MVGLFIFLNYTLIPIFHRPFQVEDSVCSPNHQCGVQFCFSIELVPINTPLHETCL